VGEVGGDTGGVDNIVEGELVNERGELQEQRQRLQGMCQWTAFPGCQQGDLPVQYRPRRRQQLRYLSVFLLRKSRGSSAV
jgi:hypothetical protein